MDDELDRVERSIDIAATAERVWSLVVRPAWYVNDGSLREHRIEKVGDIDMVHDPVHGTFPIRTIELDPPRYAAFRWLSGSGADLTEAESTLVEFWIEPRGDSGVTLRVVESGFAALDLPAEERRRRLEGNTAGWEQELVVARTHCEAAA